LGGTTGIGLGWKPPGGRTVTGHAPRADMLLIKPTADARPAQPRTHGQFIHKAHTKWPNP